MLPYIQDMYKSISCEGCERFRLDVKMLSCGHLICIDCIKSSTCPECSVKLLPKDIAESPSINEQLKYVLELAVFYGIEPASQPSPSAPKKSPAKSSSLKRPADDKFAVPTIPKEIDDASVTSRGSKSKRQSPRRPALKVEVKEEAPVDKPRHGRTKTTSEVSFLRQLYVLWSFHNNFFVQQGSEASVRSRSGSQPRFGLLGTGLTDQENNLLKKFAHMFKGKIHKDFNPNVTHVIGTVVDDRLLTTRTFKYMTALLENKWILSSKWIADCCKDKKLRNEDEYELIGTRKGCGKFGAPKISRESKKKLFQNVSIYFDGKFIGKENSGIPTLDVLIPLVEAGGATVLTSKPSSRRLTGSNDLTLVVVEDLEKISGKPSSNTIDVKALFSFITNFDFDPSAFQTSTRSI